MTEVISMGAAFVAGVLSFFSPCVVPLIPAYLANLSGSDLSELQENKMLGRVVKNALGFIVGFSLIFILLGLTASAIGRLLLQYQEVIMRLGGIIVIFFGLQLLGIINFKTLLRDLRFHQLIRGQKTNGSFLNSFILGVIFSAGWTPCIGPVLSSILVLAGTSGSIFSGFLLLAVYSLGLAIPFFLTALFIGWALDKIKKITKYLLILNKISGILLIILGILLMTNTFVKLNFLLS